MLNMNQPKKLCPFCLATDAGQNATKIHKNIQNISQTIDKL